MLTGDPANPAGPEGPFSPRSPCYSQEDVQVRATSTCTPPVITWCISYTEEVKPGVLTEEPRGPVGPATPMAPPSP